MVLLVVLGHLETEFLGVWAGVHPAGHGPDRLTGRS
jgi:hypothetical protein